MRQLHTRAGMRETEEREVVLSDCAPEALEAVLRFCYMGECRLPRRDMLSLLVLADRLDIPDLTTLAEKVHPVSLLTSIPSVVRSKRLAKGTGSLAEVYAMEAASEEGQQPARGTA